MKSATRAMLTSLLCVALSIIASAQAPSRDAGPVTPTSGTASIAGIVLDDQQPPVAVRRAVVTVAGAELVPSRSAITDDDGRFLIGVLPAGRFTITVSRGAFVTSSYGAKRPGRPGTPIVVAAGARVSDVTITLWRGAVIAGVVRDEDGEPAPGVPVRATRANAPTDRSILTLDNRGVQTNEAGEFRIFGLEPGEYLVSAVPPSLRGMAPTSMSETEMDAALAALRSRRPGTTPPPPLASTHIAPPAARPFMYAPIFFPGTPSMTQATPITLAAGQVVERLDFALQRVATAIVGGIALRPGGEPAVGASVRLVQVPPPGGFALDSPIQLTASTAADGTFRFSGVSPADYRLNVGSAVLGTAAGRGGYQGPPSGGPALWGEAMLAVAGSDLDQNRRSTGPGADADWPRGILWSRRAARESCAMACVTRRRHLPCQETWRSECRAGERRATSGPGQGRRYVRDSGHCPRRLSVPGGWAGPWSDRMVAAINGNGRSRSARSVY